MKQGLRRPMAMNRMRPRLSVYRRGRAWPRAGSKVGSHSRMNQLRKEIQNRIKKERTKIKCFIYWFTASAWMVFCSKSKG